MRISATPKEKHFIKIKTKINQTKSPKGILIKEVNDTRLLHINTGERNKKMLERSPVLMD